MKASLPRWTVLIKKAQAGTPERSLSLNSLSFCAVASMKCRETEEAEDAEGGCGIDDGFSISSARYAAKGFSEEFLREGARLFQGLIEGKGDLSSGTSQASMARHQTPVSFLGVRHPSVR